MPPLDPFTEDGVRQTGIAPVGWRDRPLSLFTAASVPPAEVLTGLYPDISNYDWDTFNAQCFEDAGVKAAMVGTQNPAMARDMIAALQGVGVQVPWNYCFHYYGDNTQPQRVTETAIRIALDMKIRVVTLDAEADDPQWSLRGSTSSAAISRRNNQLRECRHMVRNAGLQEMIYSAAWWFTPMHGGTTEFSDSPLHNANYGGNNCQLGPIRNVNFGGWAYTVMHQYCSTGGFCGRPNRDRNHVFSDAPGLKGEEMGMTPEELKRLMAVENVLAGHGTVSIFVDRDVQADVIESVTGNRPALGETVELSGLNTLGYLDGMGSNLYLGLQLFEQRLANHESAPHNAENAVKEAVGRVAWQTEMYAKALNHEAQ